MIVPASSLFLLTSLDNPAGPAAIAELGAQADSCSPLPLAGRAGPPVFFVGDRKHGIGRLRLVLLKVELTGDIGEIGEAVGHRDFSILAERTAAFAPGPTHDAGLPLMIRALVAFPPAFSR